MVCLRFLWFAEKGAFYLLKLEMKVVVRARGPAPLLEVCTRKSATVLN